MSGRAPSSKPQAARKRGLSALDKAYGKPEKQARVAEVPQPCKPISSTKIQVTDRSSIQQTPKQPERSVPESIDEGIYALLPTSQACGKLAKVLRLPDLSRTGTALEAALLKLFDTSAHAFRKDAAISSKVHDKVVLLENPVKKGLSTAAAVQTANRHNRSLTGSMCNVKRATKQGVVAALKSAVASGAVTYNTVQETASKNWDAHITSLLAMSKTASAHQIMQTCDLTGSVVQVLESVDSSRVGVRGIVVWSSMQYYHLLTDVCRIVSIPRKKSVLSVTMPESVARKGEKCITVGSLHHAGN